MVCQGCLGIFLLSVVYNPVVCVFLSGFPLYVVSWCWFLVQNLLLQQPQLQLLPLKQLLSPLTPLQVTTAWNLTCIPLFILTGGIRLSFLFFNYLLEVFCQAQGSQVLHPVKTYAQKEIRPLCPQGDLFFINLVIFFQRAFLAGIENVVLSTFLTTVFLVA